MENVILIRYDKKLNNNVDVLAKHFIAANIDMKEEELFEEVEKGILTFVYDDETGGEIDMSFGEDEESTFIKISSDYVYDVITMHEIIEPLINRVEV